MLALWGSDPMQFQKKKPRTKRRLGESTFYVATSILPWQQHEQECCPAANQLMIHEKCSSCVREREQVHMHIVKWSKSCTAHQEECNPRMHVSSLPPIQIQVWNGSLSIYFSHPGGRVLPAIPTAQQETTAAEQARDSLWEEWDEGFRTVRMARVERSY